MTTLTLEALRAEHQRLGDLIDRFSLQCEPEPTRIHFPELLIELNPGEEYAGLVIGKDGEPSHHLVLLPGEMEKANWEAAKEWADKQGGFFESCLPNRREQALLYANLKEHFADAWYWSCEPYASDAGYAWYQDFLGGTQGVSPQSNQLRARAVRRLVIE
jgi:hypothetical protein